MAAGVAVEAAVEVVVVARRVAWGLVRWRRRKWSRDGCWDFRGVGGVVAHMLAGRGMVVET
jgi:hypothetical protein